LGEKNAVLLALSILGGIGWTLTRQLLMLADELPQYSLNIHHRIADLRGASKGGSVEKVQKAVEVSLSQPQRALAKLLGGLLHLTRRP
jgi:hypothetical protein